MNIKGGLIFFVLAIFSLPGFFIAKNCLAAGEIIISEVAWAGSVESSYDEWVELKNNSNSEIDLSGWKLEATDGSPKISLSGIILPGGYFLLERTDDGSSPAVADQFYSGSLDNDGEHLELKSNNGEIVDSIDFSTAWGDGDNVTKTTAQRCGNSWSSSAIVGGTPKADNACSSSEGENISPQNNNESVPVFRFGDLLINEFLSDPVEGKNEWVEIYNPTGATIELENWYLSDGSGSKTFLSNGFKSGEKFFLIEKPKGALNNSGDEINLFSADGNLIDRIVYGDWGSSTPQNAPAPLKGFSLARREDGFKNGYFNEVFLPTSAPTAGFTNKIVAPTSSAALIEKQVVGDVFISEIFPNPIGSDVAEEFIEFYNASDKEVNLTGWRLEIRNGKQLEFGKNFLVAPVIKSKSFFVLFRSQSRAALDNNGGHLELFRPERKTPIQVLDYSEASEGESFCDTEAINIDQINSSTKSFLINALAINRWVWTEALTPGKGNEIKVKNRPPKIIFSLADANLATGTPIIFDASDSVDEDGDPIYFKWNFGDGTLVESESVGHIFLKNGEYQVRLEVGDGKSKSFLEKNIVIPPFTPIISDKKIISPTIKKIVNYAPAKESEKLVSSDTPSFFMAASKELAETDLKSFSALKIGTETQVQGNVWVEPGIFGKQYFYVSVPASPALKIYNYYGEFPKLQEGDLVVAKGEVGGGAEKYLKIKSAQDIQKISAGVLLDPEIITDNLTVDDEGRFVEMAGVIKKSDGKIFLMSENFEVRIFLKNPTNLSPSDFVDGQNGRIRGLVIGVSSGQALAPRGEEDLFFNQENQAPEALKQIATATLAVATPTAKEWVLPAQNKQNKAMVYGLILALGGLLVLGGLLFREKMKK